MFRGLRGKRLTAALCAGAVFAIIVALLSLIPLYGEICSKNEYTGNRDCAGHHVPLFLLLWIIQILDEHNGLVTAVATGFVAAFTWTLYRATTAQGLLTQGSVDLARQEFVSTHRPRIILRSASIGSVLEGEPIGIFFTLANIGETPGRIVRSVVDVTGVATNGRTRYLGHNSLEPYNEIGDLILEPGEERILSFDALNKRERSAAAPVWEKAKYGLHVTHSRQRDPVTRKPIGKWGVARQQELYLGGQFLYADGAGTLRRTAFWRKLHPERQRFYRVNEEPDLNYAD